MKKFLIIRIIMLKSLMKYFQKDLNNLQKKKRKLLYKKQKKLKLIVKNKKKIQIQAIFKNKLLVDKNYNYLN